MYQIEKYFLVLLAFNVCDTKTYKYKSDLVVKYYPFTFAYNNKDKLNMQITLANLAPEVTAYLQYQSVAELNPTENRGTFLVKERLTQNKIQIELLLNTERGICKTLLLSKGRDVKTLLGKPEKSFEFPDNDICLKSTPCLLLLDLKDIGCEGAHRVKRYNHSWRKSFVWPGIARKFNQFLGFVYNKTFKETVLDLPGSIGQQSTVKLDHFSCYRSSLEHICMLNTGLEHPIHEWFQTYDNKTFIGHIPVTTASTTKFIIELEPFDNNTYVSSTIIANKSNQKMAPIKIIIHKYTQYNVTLLSYNESTEVLFNCSEYLSRTKYVQVGRITKENKIFTNDTNVLKDRFKMADNKIILCCVLYVMYDAGSEVHIKRYIENKTLLVYDKIESTSVEVTEKMILSKDTAIIFIIVCVIGICVGVFFIIFCAKKLCKTSQSEQAMELRTYAASNPVLYADLQFPRDNSQPPTSTEETPYAQIIGVMKPPDKNAKK